MLLLFYLSIYAFPVEETGQIQGGACSRVNIYENRLYAGVGTSMYIYDINNVVDMELLGKISFNSIINEIKFASAKCFVAANHDGLWVLNTENPADIKVLSHISVQGDSAFYDIAFVGSDTLYIVDGFCVRVLHLESDNTFSEIYRFPIDNVTGIDVKGDYIVITATGTTKGHVYLYKKETVMQKLYDFSDSRIGTELGVQDVYFSSLNNDVVFVCGGTNNYGFSGHLLGLKIEDDTLKEMADYSIGGIPGIAPAMITDLDMNNDTLFLVTTAGLHGLKSDCPVLDGTNISQGFNTIAHIEPGLWFFDVAYFGSRLAIASEWYGIRWMDISSLTLSDTIKTFPTGGWGMNALVRNDTLWLAWEGYGVGVFDVSLRTKPYELGRLKGGFATDIVLRDSFAFVTKSTRNLDVYNINRWNAGEAELLSTYDAPGNNGSLLVEDLYGEDGNRIACQVVNDGVYILSFDGQSDFSQRAHILQGVDVKDMQGVYDTLIVCYKNNFAIYTIESDNPHLLCDADIGENAAGIGYDKGLVACGGKEGNIYIYGFTSEEHKLSFINKYQTEKKINDVFVKDSIVYISMGPDGMGILDAHEPQNIENIGFFPGSAGYKDAYGAKRVYLDDAGYIFLADYHAGCFILKNVNSGIVTNRNTVSKYFIKNSILYISTDFSGTVDVKVNNIIGEVVIKKRAKVDNGYVAVDIHYLAKGRYFVYIRGKRKTKRVMIFI